MGPDPERDGDVYELQNQPPATDTPETKARHPKDND